MSDIAPLLHVATTADLERARRDGIYRCASLDAEGFIHCCERDQLAGVLARHFGGVDDLVLLSIDRAALDVEVRHEGADEGPRFPHVYGPVRLDAVLERTPLGLDSPTRVALERASTR